MKISSVHELFIGTLPIILGSSLLFIVTLPIILGSFLLFIVTLPITYELSTIIVGIQIFSSVVYITGMAE